MAETMIMANAIPYDKHTKEPHLHFWTENKRQIVKLHGDFNDPEQMVITKKDYGEFRRKNNGLFNLMFETQQKKTIIYLGYSNNDPDINEVICEAVSGAKRLERQHYAILFNADKYATRFWKSSGISVINIPVAGKGIEEINQALTDFLTELYIKIQDKKNNQESIQAIDLSKAIIFWHHQTGHTLIKRFLDPKLTWVDIILKKKNDIFLVRCVEGKIDSDRIADAGKALRKYEINRGTIIAQKRMAISRKNMLIPKNIKAGTLSD